MPQKVCLRHIFVVLVVAALAQSTCIDEIREIQNREGLRLMGGYRAVENPQDDEVIKGIVADMEKEHNRQSNDLHEFVASEKGIEAYSQLVNGQNYCVEVTLVSAGCKNSLNAEFCMDEKRATCVVSAYKAFSDRLAEITPDTLVCTTSA